MPSNDNLYLELKKCVQCKFCNDNTCIVVKTAFILELKSIMLDLNVTYITKYFKCIFVAKFFAMGNHT